MDISFCRYTYSLSKIDTLNTVHIFLCNILELYIFLCNILELYIFLCNILELYIFLCNNLELIFICRYSFNSL